MIPLPIYIFIFLELSFVTYYDIKYKKISNLWSLLNIALAITLFVLFPNFYKFGWSTFQFSMVFLVVGFFLFLLKIMGGGDSKYLASFFLIVPTASQDLVFYYLLISTIIVGLIFFVRNLIEQRKNITESFKKKDIEGVKSSFGSKFAYAPVIMLTWFLIGLTNWGLL